MQRYISFQELITLNDSMRILLSREEEEIRMILRELTTLFLAHLKGLSLRLRHLVFLTVFMQHVDTQRVDRVSSEPSLQDFFLLKDATSVDR